MCFIHLINNANLYYSERSAILILTSFKFETFFLQNTKVLKVKNIHYIYIPIPHDNIS